MVLRILPGDPLVAIFGAEGYTKLSEAERAHYMAELGLSDPLLMQYLHWIEDIARGNFGRSFFRAESVAEMISRRGPLTAEIGIMAVILSWIVGIRWRLSARCAQTASGITFPGLSASFSWQFQVFGRACCSSSPRCSGLAIGRRSAGRLIGGPVGQPANRHRAGCRARPRAGAYIARMARSSLLEVIREDYVRTARAKGLSRRPVLIVHALPNALLPVITLSGILLGFVLAGSIPVERAFGTPGSAMPCSPPSASAISS